MSETPSAEKDAATLTDKEIELREWLRSQPGGAERWTVIKAGFRRSYDMGMRDSLNARLDAEKDAGRWRPLRHRLSDEALTLVAEQTAAGRPVSVHLMLVNDGGPREHGRTACDGGLGEWVTGDIEQVTCHPCIEQVHA